MKITYDEVIDRVGYFRTKANLSLRETSTRLGYNPQFMKTIENKSIELKVSTLLEFCDVVGIDIQDFFYLGKQYSTDDKHLLELFASLSDDSKKLIVELMKKLK
ncbi:MAG TPA: helix-turn-helix transcriptional regulator [Candidatus Limihabitans stercoravium]|nr:helix-turn-helix transcriptional regulator [Candidatus Limihabitans stercoravium]